MLITIEGEMNAVSTGTIINGWLGKGFGTKIVQDYEGSADSICGGVFPTDVEGLTRIIFYGDNTVAVVRAAKDRDDDFLRIFNNPTGYLAFNGMQDATHLLGGKWEAVNLVAATPFARTPESVELIMESVRRAKKMVEEGLIVMTEQERATHLAQQVFDILLEA